MFTIYSKPRENCDIQHRLVASSTESPKVPKSCTVAPHKEQRYTPRRLTLKERRHSAFVAMHDHSNRANVYEPPIYAPTDFTTADPFVDH